MKKKSVGIIFILFTLLIYGSPLKAQNEINYEAEGGLIQFNIFHFEGSKDYNITLPLTDKMDKLNIEIKAYIGSGELSVDIYDPSGERQGNFSVRGQLNHSNSSKKNEINRSTELITSKMRIEREPWIFKEAEFKEMGMGNKVAQASISRSFRSPIKGDWVIKIICKDAKGLFTLENNDKLLKGILPTKFVTGTVTDKMGRPLIGAIIKIKGEYPWTTSDSNGNFTIPIRDVTETIVIQYKRMIPKEIVVGEHPEFKVIIDPQK
jgi:hypothetical protein